MSWRQFMDTSSFSRCSGGPAGWPVCLSLHAIVDLAGRSRCAQTCLPRGLFFSMLEALIFWEPLRYRPKFTRITGYV